MKYINSKEDIEVMLENGVKLVPHHSFVNLQKKLKIAIKALKSIDFLVPEGKRADCIGCDYDGYINTKHHPECTYVIVSQALSKIKEIK